MHTGGIVGLGPDEVGTILQRGEEVVTKNNPRHRANGGLSPASGGMGDLHITNLFDPADMLSKALATKKGQSVLVNHVTNNSRSFKAAMG